MSAVIDMLAGGLGILCAQPVAVDDVAPSAEPIGGSVRECADLPRRDFANNGKVVAVAGIKVD